jgi:glycosyltransferase involved in cell wall biosynthesis
LCQLWREVKTRYEVNRMSRKSVLIVTYGFPPHIKSLGGAVRMLKLAEYLQNNGCAVQVLCARTAYFDTYGYDELLASLKVTYVDDPVAIAGARVFGGNLDRSIEIKAKQQGIKSRFKQFVIDALTPDTAVLTISRMRRIARNIVAAQPNMTVITSGPPHSAHLVGYWLKVHFPPVQWVVDYRDSWNATSLFRKRNSLLQKLNERFERRVLTRCDHFTYISSPMLNKAQLLCGVSLAAKSHLIANGFDTNLLEIFRNMKPQAGPLRLGYFGAIDDGKDSYRNPGCIFNAISSLPELAIHLELYGSIQISAAWQAKLGDRLVVGPRLSHQKALEKMASMDALLLLHTREDGADEVVTGKVFEYVASGLPIVSIGPANMAVNGLLSDDASAFRAEHTNQSAIAELLIHLVDCKKRQNMPKRDQRRLGSYSRESQFQNFLHLINEH